MKLPIRILVPIVLAALCALGLIGFLWWQLSQSTAILKHVSTYDPVIAVEQAPMVEEPIDPRDSALLHLRQGDLFALRGEWSLAQEEYEKSVKADGGLPALRKLAQAQLQRRDMNGVRSTIRELKRGGARPEDLLLLESIVSLRSGELVEARTRLEAAEDSPHKHYGLALLAIVEGNHQNAQERLETVSLGWEPILRSHAKVLLKAYEEFNLFPTGSNIHLITLVARALAQVQECEVALPLLIQVTQVQSDYRDAWIVQGYCELVTERYIESRSSLEQAYQIDPSKPEIQYFLARAYAAGGDDASAITFYQYALVNGFEPPIEVRRSIAQSALRLGNIEGAYAQYAAMIQDPLATIDAYNGAVSTAIALGKTEEALLSAQAATDRYSSNAGAWVLLGNAAKESENMERAKEAYEKALDLNPYLKEAEEGLLEMGKTLE